MLRLRIFAAPLVAFFAFCSGSERQVVDTFLTAVQAGNQETVKAVSVVAFPGNVSSWEVVEVGPVSSRPFKLAELESNFSKVMGERKVEQEKNDYFRQEHQRAFDEYTVKREKDPEYEFSGEMADFQKEWEARESKHKELDHAAMDLQKEIDHLRSSARLSASTNVNENFEGEVSERELTVKINDGSADKLYTFTIQKFSIVDTKRDIRPIGRWVISQFQEKET